MASMHKIQISLLVLVTLLSAVAYGSNVLVLLDSWAITDTHSIFFEELIKRNHKLDFHLFSDADITLRKYDEFLYDNILLFAPSATDYPKSFKHQDILDFYDQRGNLMIFGDVDSNQVTRKLLNEFGADLNVQDSKLFDSVYMAYGIAYKKGYTEDDIVYTKNVLNEPSIFSASKEYILYRGVGHVIDNANKYLFPILKAESTTYSLNVKTHEIDEKGGDKIVLVSGYQGRNNNRVVMSGSIDMCSDELIFLSSAETNYKSYSSNYKFCMEAAEWAFKERGLLKAENLHHKRTNDDEINPLNYRILQDINFYVDILEWDNSKKQWKPFHRDDVMLEFIMLDPYYRIKLDKEGATFKKTFISPEKNGIYKFRIDYQHPGYTSLDISQEVTVRHFWHNEYGRYFGVAYPHYTAIFLLLIAFCIFVPFFLFTKPVAAQAQVSRKKNQ